MEQEEKKFQLPSALSISKFSVARGKEIQILNAALSSFTGIKLAFQKLPKHMRRRAMSHNVKRLPRRLREIHMNQMTKSGLPPKQKRPSRKYRRRPYNLISDYLKRQRKCLWLNTHIWHAKRFHMVDKWGYKLPYSPCDRAFKACYRATVKHCLLQDISYYNCLEVTGDSNFIIKGFKDVIHPNIDMNISAKAVIRGLRQGSFTLFRFGTKEPIGIIYFLWRPCTPSNKRSLWLWLHAAYYNEAFETIKEVFCLNTCNSENNSFLYKNDQVELRVLKYDLSRFRLTGPLANIILWNALKTTCIEHISSDCNAWVKSFIDNQEEDYLSNLKERWDILQFTSSPAEFPPNIVLPFIAQDPRFNMPKKRTKALFSYSNVDVNKVLWNKVLDNPLWDEKFRSLSGKNKPSQASLSKLREALLVPGSSVDEVPTLLPITLIHRPGKGSKEFNGYGCGWDIILPSAWAQPVWLSLIMWGARSGGLREMDSVIFESDQQHFLLPDTKSGKIEENIISCKFQEDFFKMPPNKRTNFNKFGISSPFNWNWQLLLREWGWNEESSSFFVLRNKTVLYNLQNLINCKTITKPLPDISENVLVPVSLKFVQKGSCSKLAIICLPNIEDLKVVPEESYHEDPNEIKRKVLRQEHKDLLKQLKRKRKRARKNGEKIPLDMETLKVYSQKMRQLWVPETEAIRHSCSREVMGFVKHGDFSFLLAKTKAIGYVTINSLKKLLEMQINKVLVRNTNSRQYRLAVLDIITEI